MRNKNEVVVNHKNGFGFGLAATLGSFLAVGVVGLLISGFTSLMIHFSNKSEEKQG